MYADTECFALTFQCGEIQESCPLVSVYDMSVNDMSLSKKLNRIVLKCIP